jgi:hypothetical protein
MKKPRVLGKSIGPFGTHPVKSVSKVKNLKNASKSKSYKGTSGGGTSRGR